LDFFRSKDHAIRPSDSLIPQGDPTLLFTGAGMNQFKEYFLGLKKDMTRAATCQKCLRTGDLDNVGKTPYHHSFFEMLGNFSFGNYFKEDAIAWAVEFLTEQLRIPLEKLRFSVHSDDEEAYRIWTEKLKIPADRVKKLGDRSNFWPANARADGPNGPCGPCSEIFYDQGNAFGCGHATCDVDCDCGRFAEIWNLVFTQFNRQEGGALPPLAAKNIDTGAGLERIACVMQGKRNNFEIDTLQPLVDWTLRKFGKHSSPNALLLSKIIVDHTRAATFAIADGVQPSNEGRGYVIRKLIRRAVWRSRSLADQTPKEPLLAALAAETAKMMEEAYPELARELPRVQMLLRGEEERFLETLEEGKKVLSRMTDEALSRSEKKLPADAVFKLYDTYGFPDELTSVIAAEKGLAIDTAGFESLMENQRQRAKEASKIADSIFVAEDVPAGLKGQPETRFLGYQTLETPAVVLFAEKRNDAAWIVLDQTPFYAEQGGQVGDQGRLEWEGRSVPVLNTQKKDIWIAHQIDSRERVPSPGTSVFCKVNRDRRNAIRRHHTATHLLHAALRKILGPHVRQLGSLVSPEKLRFDFSHPKAVTEGELGEIENFVNSAILENLPVSTDEKNLRDAQQEGALAFFGEKYKDRVRMVSVAADLSKELCGGTHVARTGDIGILLITEESSVGSGTRRIEAVSGFAALDLIRKTRLRLDQAANTLRVPADEIPEQLAKLLKKVRESEKSKSKSGVSADEIRKMTEAAQTFGNLKLVSPMAFSGVGVNELRSIADQIRKAFGEQECVTILFTVDENRSVRYVIASATPKIDASKLADQIARVLKGSGGGKKEFAQGGGKSPELLESARAEIPNMIAEFLKT